VLEFVLFDFLDRHAVPFKRLIETADRSFGLSVVLDDMTLQSMYRAPVDARTVLVIAAEIHFDGRPGRIVCGPTHSV
jgi:hypothetical protein